MFQQLTVSTSEEDGVTKIEVSGPRGSGKTTMIHNLKRHHENRGYLVFMSDEVTKAALAASNGKLCLITEVMEEPA